MTKFEYFWIVYSAFLIIGFNVSYSPTLFRYFCEYAAKQRTFPAISDWFKKNFPAVLSASRTVPDVRNIAEKTRELNLEHQSEADVVVAQIEAWTEAQKIRSENKVSSLATKATLIGAMLAGIFSLIVAGRDIDHANEQAKLQRTHEEKTAKRDIDHATAQAELQRAHQAKIEERDTDQAKLTNALKAEQNRQGALEVLESLLDDVSPVTSGIAPEQLRRLERRESDRRYIALSMLAYKEDEKLLLKTAARFPHEALHALIAEMAVERAPTPTTSTEKVNRLRKQRHRLTTLQLILSQEYQRLSDLNEEVTLLLDEYEDLIAPDQIQLIRRMLSAR